MPNGPEKELIDLIRAAASEYEMVLFAEKSSEHYEAYLLILKRDRIPWQKIISVLRNGHIKIDELVSSKAKTVKELRSEFLRKTSGTSFLDMDLVELKCSYAWYQILANMYFTDSNKNIYLFDQQFLKEWSND